MFQYHPYLYSRNQHSYTIATSVSDHDRLTNLGVVLKKISAPTRCYKLRLNKILIYCENVLMVLLETVLYWKWSEFCDLFIVIRKKCNSYIDDSNCTKKSQFYSRWIMPRKLLKFLILFDNTSLLYFPGQFLSGRVLLELQENTPVLGKSNNNAIIYSKMARAVMDCVVTWHWAIARMVDWTLFGVW